MSLLPTIFWLRLPSVKFLKEIQTRLGVNVLRKDSKMSMRKESFIIDAIIVEKLKYPGDSKKIPTANLLKKGV